MDAISLLEQDHRKVEQLFAEFEGTDDPQVQRRLVDTLIEELSVHAAIEEQELYPVMRRAFEQDELVEEAEHEHAEVKAVLAVLSKLPPADPHFREMVNELIADVRHHVEDEEQELFPQLRERVQQAELEELAQRLERARGGAPRKPSAEELLDLTQEELYGFAQKIELDGRSDMSKEELAEALMSA